MKLPSPWGSLKAAETGRKGVLETELRVEGRVKEKEMTTSQMRLEHLLGLRSVCLSF